MEIDKRLIQHVFRRVNPRDLDRVLTAIEAYRVCISTLQKLERVRHLSQQRKEVEECAQCCERALWEYLETGDWKHFDYPPAGRPADFQRAHFVLVFHR